MRRHPRNFSAALYKLILLQPEWFSWHMLSWTHLINVIDRMMLVLCTARNGITPHALTQHASLPSCTRVVLHYQIMCYVKSRTAYDSRAGPARCLASLKLRQASWTTHGTH